MDRSVIIFITSILGYQNWYYQYSISSIGIPPSRRILHLWYLKSSMHHNFNEMLVNLYIIASFLVISFYITLYSNYKSEYLDPDSSKFPKREFILKANFVLIFAHFFESVFNMTYNR